MKKTKEDMDTVLTYLNEGPKNLTSFDYKDWDDDVTEKVITVIKNTIPEQRLINEIVGGVASSSSRPAPTQSAPVQSAPAPKQNSESELYAEVNQTKVAGHVEREESSSPSNNSSSSLEDLYNDL
jgi:hypothetical protein